MLSMKGSLVSVLAVCLAALALSGCGEKSRDHAASAGPQSAVATAESSVTDASESAASLPETRAQTITRVSNGDKLVFGPKSGLIRGQRKDGAPRLLTKGPGGRVYWELPKTEASRARSSATSDAAR